MNVAPLVLRIRVAIRQRRMAAVGLAVLVAVGVGVVLTLAAGARRTASAPDRYTASVGGDPDTTLVQPDGRPQTSAVRALPIVRELRSVTFLTALVAVGTEEYAAFAGDGYAEARLVAGRQPTASHEFVTSKPFADRAGLHVGDHVRVRTFTQQQADDHTAFVADSASCSGNDPARKKLNALRA